MLYHLDVEDMEPNHWVAYVTELPGCFSRGHTYDDAVAQSPVSIAAHLNWLTARGANTRLAAEPIEVEVTEVFHSFASEGDYIVNAFFQTDRKPLADDAEQSIEAILDHIGWAEWWYLDRMGLAFPREEVPIEPLTKLRIVRDEFVNVLPGLVGDERVVERVGEHWSARKILRRALWHERDHTQQIASLVRSGG